MKFLVAEQTKKAVKAKVIAKAVNSPPTFSTIQLSYRAFLPLSELSPALECMHVGWVGSD